MNLYEAKSGKLLEKKKFTLNPESCLETRYFSNEIIEKGVQELRRGLDTELVEDEVVVDKSFFDKLTEWLEPYIVD